MTKVLDQLHSFLWLLSRCVQACIRAMQRVQSPAEIVWLNGAPGSGKGTNTPFILESRGLSRAVTMCAAVLDYTRACVSACRHFDAQLLTHSKQVSEAFW